MHAWGGLGRQEGRWAHCRTGGMPCAPPAAGAVPARPCLHALETCRPMHRLRSPSSHPSPSLAGTARCTRSAWPAPSASRPTCPAASSTPRPSPAQCKWLLRGNVRGWRLTFLYLSVSSIHMPCSAAHRGLPPTALTRMLPPPTLPSPCRCYTACMWARLEHVYYGAKYEDVMEHGK